MLTAATAARSFEGVNVASEISPPPSDNPPARVPSKKPRRYDIQIGTKCLLHKCVDASRLWLCDKPRRSFVSSPSEGINAAAPRCISPRRLISPGILIVLLNSPSLKVTPKWL